MNTTLSPSRDAPPSAVRDTRSVTVTVPALDTQLSWADRLALRLALRLLLRAGRAPRRASPVASDPLSREHTLELARHALLRQLR